MTHFWWVSVDNEQPVRWHMIWKPACFWLEWGCGWCGCLDLSVGNYSISRAVSLTYCTFTICRLCLVFSNEAVTSVFIRSSHRALTCCCTDTTWKSPFYSVLFWCRLVTELHVSSLSSLVPFWTTMETMWSWTWKRPPPPQTGTKPPLT